MTRYQESCLLHTRYTKVPSHLLRGWSMRCGLRLGELSVSVRVEADRCTCCSIEVLLERDDGSAIYVLCLRHVPKRSDSSLPNDTAFYKVLAEWPLLLFVSCVNKLSKLTTDRPLYKLPTDRPTHVQKKIHFEWPCSIAGQKLSVCMRLCVNITTATRRDSCVEIRITHRIFLLGHSLVKNLLP